MLKPDKVVRSTCPYCGVGCQLNLHIHNNTIYRVSGPFHHPPNDGKMCVKGRFGHDYLWHPDRLTQPLIRKGDRLVATSWHHAINLIGQHLSDIKKESGPDSIAFMASAKCTNEENYLFQKFARQVIGTNNIDHCARL